ncbi:MAG: response regulator [Clostridia bacterium]
MWRILIADDEPKIRRGLHAQIERMALDLQVVGEAEDGEQALKCARESAPDIVLVDINMPFLNGLDFIERLKGVCPDARTIVVTGFEDFEYVRRSMRLNVQSYLLKPVATEELRAALEKAVGELGREREHNRHFRWAMEQLEKRRDSLCEAFLKDAVSGTLAEEEMPEMLRFFGFEMMKRARLLLVALGSGAPGDQPLKRLMVRYALVDAAKPHLQRCRSACVFSDERENLLVFYDADRAVDEALTKAVEHAITGEFGLKAQLLGAPVEDACKLCAVYDHLIEEMLHEGGVSPIVEAAQRYIEAQYRHSELTLPDVADALGVNPSYLSRLMKQELGMSFSKYLTQVRIGRAVQLISLGDMRMRDIAEEVGYSAANYFSTAFKRVLGVPPAEYHVEARP